MESEHNSRRWQFSIDVGGTFTDCIFVRPDGSEGQQKVLSSSTCKGRPKILSSFTNQLADESHLGLPHQFYRGFKMRFLDSDGQIAHQSTVLDFDGTTGTFAFDPFKSTSQIHSFELLSPEPSPLLAIRRACKLSLEEAIPDCELRLGTTRGTNALLTRTGAKTAFITTAGFKNILEIGDQTRPNLFELDIRKPEPLYSVAVEVNERIMHDGTVETKLDQDQVREELRQLQLKGIESLAICLIHGFRFPEHEKMIEQIANEFDFANVSRSSRVAPLIKIVPRGETTLLDAYLNPLLVKYIADIQQKLTPGSNMQLITSAGTLVPPNRFSGKESTLSGPAGGVVGMARTAESIGITKVIGFDMGGTSTDVSRYDGQFNYEYESKKAGVRIFSPVMAIETVASGGGSICRFDGTRLLVGPESAGADPGPACYGRSGPLTMTDVNLYLGRIDENHFPFTLDHDIVESHLRKICEHVNQTPGADYDSQKLAEGFFTIANTQMAAAVQSVSVAKGFDVRDYTLVGFGGAAGQHLCAVADKLKIKRTLVHPFASLLSAFGIRFAQHSAAAVRSILKAFDEITLNELKTVCEDLVRENTSRLVSESCLESSIVSMTQIEMRFQGTESYLAISFNDNIVEAFRAEHERQFGYVLDRPIEFGAMHVISTSNTNQDRLLQTCEIPESEQETEVRSDQFVRIRKNERTLAAQSFDRRFLRAGQFVLGPAQIFDSFTNLIVDPGWQASICADQQILLERIVAIENLQNGDSDKADPTMLEVFNNHFRTIADQMGTTLQKTSCSVNVKERLDFSCAVFDSIGDLVVNAQHIPVHLGAMSETVKATIRLNPSIQHGDVFVTNDPFEGGSHLPDVTVITPVFTDAKDDLPLFFVASRSHHAEIGGIAPGSMPPAATNLAEEGILISNFKLLDRGQPRFDALKTLLESTDFPSRSSEVNIADIQAQVAANRRGLHDLLSLIETHSAPTVARYMKSIMESAATKVRAAIQRLPESLLEFHDFLDNHLKICVSIKRQGERLSIDFTGSSPQSSDNHNANSGIVSAAIMYSLRCLIDEDIPLNQGLLAPVDVVLPNCFLNPARGPNADLSPAVAAGNVETSQRIVDVLLAAFGLAAASQGTMNNLLLGDSTFGYYETICGGAGATSTCTGESAVQTHMTNTRMTDPEIIETVFPMILRQFSIRSGSGGAGRFRGGDGIRREIEFKKRLTVSILSNRREEFPPFGLSGGKDGKTGVNWLIRDGKKPQRLAGRCTFEVNAGDRILIETPGGGGYGAPKNPTT